MDPIASRPSAVAVAVPVNLELTVPTVAKHAMPEHLRPLSVWWVDALDALPVNMAQQRGNPMRLHVKIAVLENFRTCLVQPVNRLAKIV
jgi:hypothetical protein